MVLGNPPWERIIKLQERVVYKAAVQRLPGHAIQRERRKRIKGLQQNDPALYAAFKGRQTESRRGQPFVRNKGRLPAVVAAQGTLTLSLPN